MFFVVSVVSIPVYKYMFSTIDIYLTVAIGEHGSPYQARTNQISVLDNTV